MTDRPRRVVTARTDFALAESEASLQLCRSARRLLVFTGAGLSCSAGLSAFSDANGLYERARRRFGLSEGVKLFCYSFLLKRRADAQSFLADVLDEAQAAQPTAAHAALLSLSAAGRLLRHATMNVDGLHRQRGGGGLWSETTPQGATLELHGCVLDAVCQRCARSTAVSASLARSWRAGRTPRCTAEGCGAAPCEREPLLRPKVLFYGDGESELITPPGCLQEPLEGDAQGADAILWVGISFQQSASVELFRNIRRSLQAVGRDGTVPQVLVNPDPEAKFNLLSALSAAENVPLHAARLSADEFLSRLAEGCEGAAEAACGKRERAREEGDAGAKRRKEWQEEAEGA